MIFFEEQCLATTYAGCDDDKIRSVDRYDSIFDYPESTPPSYLDDIIRTVSSYYARVQITSKVKLNSNEMEVHYKVIDLVSFTDPKNQPAKAGAFKYSLKPIDYVDYEGDLVSPCPELRYESLMVGSEYLFELMMESSNTFRKPDAPYIWNDQAKKRLEYLKFFADFREVKLDNLVKTIRTLIIKDPKKALILMALFENRIPKQYLRRLGAQAFVANGNLQAAYKTLTYHYFHDSPNADNLFMAMQTAILLKSDKATLENLDNFLLRIFLEKRNAQMTPSSVDLKYWKSFIASSSFKLLKKNPEQLQTIIQKWIAIRTCGVGERGPMIAWSKELDLSRAVVACENPPSGTVVWLSSLPLVSNQNPELSIVIAKPYYLLRDSALAKDSLIGVTSFAKSRAPEDRVPTRKRVLNYTYNCSTSRCKLVVACALDPKQKTNVQSLPIGSKDIISNIENSFFKILYGITNNFNTFSNALSKATKLDGDSEPYLSLGGYSQMLKDVQSYCKL